MTHTTLKVILADIAPRNASKRELKERMDELQSLVATYG